MVTQVLLSFVKFRSLKGYTFVTASCQFVEIQEIGWSIIFTWYTVLSVSSCLLRSDVLKFQCKSTGTSQIRKIYIFYCSKIMVVTCLFAKTCVLWFIQLCCFYVRLKQLKVVFCNTIANSHIKKGLGRLGLSKHNRVFILSF